LPVGQAEAPSELFAHPHRILARQHQRDTTSNLLLHGGDGGRGKESRAALRAASPINAFCTFFAAWAGRSVSVTMGLFWTRRATLPGRYRKGVTLRTWRPRRDLNPCYRRERAQTNWITL